MSLSDGKTNIKVEVICEQCKTKFHKKKYDIKRTSKHFCSTRCFGNSKIINDVSVTCLNCSVSFNKKKKETIRNPNHFCSRSCSATYNNKKKTTGNRRSKLENFIEEKLTNLNLDFPIHFNRKDTIDSELDIYIPSLNLAFELNGIFHYRPIFGQSKLDKIVKNDKEKKRKCKDKNIELICIDTREQEKFSEETSIPYLTIILEKIKTKKENQ